MFVKTVPLEDVLVTNTYFYIDEETKHGFLIDPAAEPKKLLDIIRDEGWTIEKMLITHGHFDHIGAVGVLHERLGIPYYAHQAAQDYLSKPKLNLSAYCGRDISLTEASFFQDDDEIYLEANPSAKLKVIHTPGHTADSVLFYDVANHLAFVGDTIFKGSIGATHFPGGDFQQLKQSLLQKVFSLPEETVLYSGHSEATTIRQEKNQLL